ncbi:hypothetical protein BY996DRAFT_4575827 [Phakopsora pachyrhizi]|nr:hypothetical protein BY996DRAFT_4575827 [Phakopsora pachyrhizi]
MQSPIDPRTSTPFRNEYSKGDANFLTGRPISGKDQNHHLGSPVFAISKSSSTIDGATSFNAVGSHRLERNDSTELGKAGQSPPPRGPSAFESIYSSRKSINPESVNYFSPGAPRLSFDSATAKSFQPASLPAPRNNCLSSNIWAQAWDTTNNPSSATDLDIHSPLIGQKTLIARRFSHMGSNIPLKSPLVGSPSSLADLNGASTLNVYDYRNNLSPTSPLSRGLEPNSLPSKFYGQWGDSNPLAFGSVDEERTGRSRARDIIEKGYPKSCRDPSVGSIGSPCSSSACSGIGLSNMSPFTGKTLLPPGAMSLGCAIGSTPHADSYGRSNRARDSSLGAIGTGRMNTRSSAMAIGAIGTGLGLSSRLVDRGSDGGFVGSVGSPATDSWFMGSRSLSNDLDEDDELAPPTKSGATSRRHSVAAFTGRNFAQGFEQNNTRPSIPSSNPHERKSVGHLDGLSFGSEGSAAESQSSAGLMFGSGNLALTDEDLLFPADFSSLSLNLEAHATKQRHNPTSFEFNHSSQAPSDAQLEPAQPSNSRLYHGNSQPSFTPSMPWSTPSSNVSQLPPPSSATFCFEPSGRRSSFSAGDPFSASAQASRYFASQLDGSLLNLPNSQLSAPRFPLGASGLGSRPSASLSGPSVTPFNAGGLLSTNSNLARQQMESDLVPPGSAGFPPAGSPFDAFLSSPMYSQIAQSQITGSPVIGTAHSASGLSGPPSLVTSYRNSPGLFNPSLATPGPGPNELGELGKGIPLHLLPKDCPLYIVEFKAGRTDLFYFSFQDGKTPENIQRGDLVIVEADRGKDLGKVIRDSISVEDVQKFQNQQVEIALSQLTGSALTQQTSISTNVKSNNVSGAEPSGQPQISALNPASIARLTKEIHPKKIFGKASQADVSGSTTKAQDEAKALALCRSKALQRGLEMEITSAEWQWDRRKLTFFFIADKRVDFRDLVKDLFRTWKTRIWLDLVFF